MACESHIVRTLDGLGLDRRVLSAGTVHSFLRYHQEPETSAYVHYMHHSYLISLGFLITRIIGYSLMARWLYKCGPEVEELLLPPTHDESSSQI